MNNHLLAIAQQCTAAAYEGAMGFPTIVRTLIEAGFEGYAVDYRRASAVYFHGDGACVDVALPNASGAIAIEFDSTGVEQAVREAQTQAPGYTYAGFCAKVKAAGCAGYMVSFSGRRVVYFGRTAETHVEHFPS